MATGDDKPPPIVYIRPMPTERDALLLKQDSISEYSERVEPNAPPEEKEIVDEYTTDDDVEQTNAKRMAIISLVVMLVLVLITFAIFFDNRPFPSSGTKQTRKIQNHKDYSTNYIKKHHKALVTNPHGKKKKKGKKHKHKHQDEAQLDDTSNTTAVVQSSAEIPNKLFREIGVPEFPDIDSLEDDVPAIVTNNEQLTAVPIRKGKKHKHKHSNAEEVVVSNSTTNYEETSQGSNQYTEAESDVDEFPVINILSAEEISAIDDQRDPNKGKLLRRTK